MPRRTPSTATRHVKGKTGARNRGRSGRSNYHHDGKASAADRYGEFSNGRRVRPELIAGRTLSYALNTGGVE